MLGGERWLLVAGVTCRRSPERSLKDTKKDTPPQWKEELGELELTRNDDRVAYTLLEALEENNPKMI